MLDILAQSLMLATRFHHDARTKPLGSYELRQEMLLHERRLRYDRLRAASVLHKG
jgi:hypothetical protein